ncbi:MAG: Tfp pilus assembly protein FimT/FimU [Planctomycetota bacterium]
MRSRTRSRTGIAPLSRGGYTLIELVVVIIILGILASMAIPRLEGLSPRYRLRAAAREVGAKIHWVRNQAGGAGERYGLHYDLEEGKLWIILPPGPDDDPDLALEDRERLTKLELPRAIRIDEVLLADGSSVQSGGVEIEFDPYGHEGSHIVYLRNELDALIAVKFNALLGIVDYFVSEVEFEEY